MGEKDELEIETSKNTNIEKGGNFSSGGELESTKELSKKYSKLLNAIKNATVKREDEDRKTDYETYKRITKFYQQEMIKFSNELDIVKGELKKTKVEFNDKIKKTIKETNEELSHKIDDSKLRTIETLGVFVALFTFVAVNVQIFTRVTHLRSAMWFTVLLMGALGLFSLIVHVIINEEDKHFNLEYGKLKLYISRKFQLLILFLFFIFIALSIKDEELNIVKENKESIKIENQGSSVETRDNNIPIEAQQS